MAATFHHFGVPTTQKMGEEVFIEGGKVYVTDPDASPFRIEFLRFEADSPMHELVQKNAHAAYCVDDLDGAIAGKRVLVEPFDATPTLRVAFIAEGDAVLELMQNL